MSIDSQPQPERSVAEREPFVAIVEPDATFRGQLLEVLGSTATSTFDSLGELVEVGLQRISTVVVVLGPSQSDRHSIEQLGSLSRIRSGVGGLVVVEALTADVMRSALRAGLNDAIVLGEIEEELEPVVRSLATRLELEVSGVTGSRHFTSSRGSGRGRVTAVFSPKGGVGKSALSVNLAVALARQTDEPVVLVDLDLQFGDLAVMLRLQPIHHIGEIGHSADFDADFVQGLLLQHEPSGVWLLAAPTSPSVAENLDGRSISRLIEVLRGIAGQVIVDTPPVLSEIVLQLLDEADDVAFVVGMDVPSVKNARIALHALQLVGIPQERVLLVLNRADSKVNLAVRDVERTLGRAMDVRIPSDVIVTQSINKGIPAVLEYERSSFARSLSSMAARLHERSSAGEAS